MITTKQRNKFKTTTGRVETKGVRRHYFPQVHTNSWNLWACDNTFKHFCYFHRGIWCWCSNVMLPQQSCPSTHSTRLPKRKTGKGKKKNKKKQKPKTTLLTDCVWHLSWQEYSERRKEKRSQGWEGENGGVLIDVWNNMCEKNQQSLLSLQFGVLFFMIRRPGVR